MTIHTVFWKQSWHALVCTTLALAADVGAGALASAQTAPKPAIDMVASAEAGAAFTAPFTFNSEHGQLSVTMEAKETPVRIGRYAFNGATYNDVYAGPVLRLHPGDTLHFRLINHLAQATNVHFHGLGVSPEGHSDNSMHMVKPGETWEYVIAIPKDHPPGVYWYHTHGHDFAEHQLMGGLSGTLVIEGFQDELPATKPLRERLFALKEFSPDGKGGLNRVPKPVNGTVKTINGQLSPVLDIQPGETQLWRLSDQTANTYFRLRLEGHHFTIVGRDARPILHPETVEQVMIGPSERMDVVVTAKAAGRFRLISEPTATGPVGDMFPPQTLAWVQIAPDPSRPQPAPLAPLVVNAPKQKPISGDHIDARRLVSFSEDPVTGLFFINHQTFDPERVDVQVPLGSIEEWEVRNASEELHVFHIHQVAFQVLGINGKAVPFQGLQDTIDVPIHGSVKLRIPFTDPVILGKFMFHCHILEHEDKGMMAQIEVYDPKKGPSKEGMSMGDGHDVQMGASSASTAKS